MINCPFDFSVIFVVCLCCAIERLTYSTHLFTHLNTTPSSTGSITTYVQLILFNGERRTKNLSVSILGTSVLPLCKSGKLYYRLSKAINTKCTVWVYQSRFYGRNTPTLNLKCVHRSVNTFVYGVISYFHSFLSCLHPHEMASGQCALLPRQASNVTRNQVDVRQNQTMKKDHLIMQILYTSVSISNNI